MENRVSNAQLEELLEFLRERPLIAKGVGLGPRAKETVDREWDNLASRLNAYGDGATKTSQRWKRYWTDLKHKTKSKISKRRQDAMRAGGGPPLVGELNTIESKIIEILSKGRRLEKTKRTRPQPALQNEWVEELENRRVESEEKLACAALKTAEAARMQAQAALAQAEAAKLQADNIRELINIVKEYFNK